jgi:diguanylate cyclase (GGDEF)-like protein
MAVAQLITYDLPEDDDAYQARLELDRARRAYHEHPGPALTDAIGCYEVGRSLEDSALCARALALQGAVSLHRGDLRGALALAVDAERHSEQTDDPVARVEVATLKAQLCFFTGSYAEALSHAELALGFADKTRDADLRVYARRATCMVFANVRPRDWPERLEELLALTIDSGEPWEEAVSRNDLACYRQELGDLDGAQREIECALDIAVGITSGNSFVLAVIHSTRADIRLLAGSAEDALDDAERSIAMLTADADPNPYVLGATVRAAVQARMALGRLDDAQRSGEDVLGWLGDRLPQTRSLILSTLATALREAGRFEEAYDALARAAELERQAFRELSDLQRSLERATLEIRAARSERDALAAKNSQLAEAHAELERRATTLERLQDQLRDQADRDWLTGLRNRRYLARRELEGLTQEQLVCPLSLAVLDLDHFKSINDRFGHETGDEVLVRVAAMLSETLRESDVVVRSGGEEFLVVMPLTDARAAGACCERVRRAISDERWEEIADGLTVTTSIGIASTQEPSELEALVRVADQRLYEAKHAGRDRVVGEDRAAVHAQRLGA